MRPVENCRYLVAVTAVLVAAAALPVQGAGSSVDLLVLSGRSFLCLYEDSFLFNRGDGTFHAVYYGADMFDGVAVGDFDGNGTVDLGTGNGLFLGLGDGHFLLVGFLGFNEILDCGGRKGNALAFADMDVDGRLDLLYACGTRLYIFYNRGDEHWLEGDHKTQLLERGPVLETTTENRGCGEGRMICEVGDLDENGFPDVYAGQLYYAPPILYNQGDGTFSRIWRKQGNYDEPSEIIDLDGDGHLDIVTVLSGERLGVERGDGRGNFLPGTYDLQSEGLYVVNFAFADLDKNQRLDVALVGYSPHDDQQGAIFLLFGEPDGSLGRLQKLELPRSFAGEHVSPKGIAAADLDGDGFQDLAVSNLFAPGMGTVVPGAILAFYGAGDGTFRGPTYFDGPQSAGRIYALGDIDRRFIRGDANDDGKVDLSDAVSILWALFLDGPVACGQALDVNDDSAADLTDTVYLLQFLFQGGAPPPSPFPEAGIDETDPDRLGCSPLTWQYVHRQR